MSSQQSLWLTVPQTESSVPQSVVMYREQLTKSEPITENSEHAGLSRAWLSFRI